MAAESTPMNMDGESDSARYGEDISPEKDGGVRKIIKVAGRGGGKPPIGSKVRVHYCGKFMTGEEFDSNIGKKDPFEFEHGKGVVIRGWDIAIATMEVNETSLFTIKPQYAYGTEGSGNKIPPNACLQFEITLVEWKGEDITKDGLVTKIVLEKGEGYVCPNTGALCEVHIVGKCQGKVFEDREVSFFMQEGTEEGLLLGVQQAILKMNDGEKAHVWIKPGKWGFGMAGNPDLGIPKDAVIEYVIHLKKFESVKENWELSNEEKLSTALSLKEKGTRYFREEKFSIAIEQYARAVKMLDGYFSNEEKEKRDPLLLAGHLNLAACHLKLNHNFKCIKECNKALQLEKDNVKALFRRGKARAAINDLDLAKKDFELVLKFQPGNREAQQQLNSVNSRIKHHVAKERVIFANMFERLARKEERESIADTKTRDVFEEATEAEQRLNEQSRFSEITLTSLPVSDQATSSTGVNGKAENDVEMKEDEKGGVIC